MTAIELSKNIIAYAAMNECQVTNLKLQKTLYYVQGYYLARFGKPLFEDEIVNWAYGPVVPEAYFQFCSYGATVITPEPMKMFFSSLNNSETGYVCKVINACLQRTARQLVEKTHTEAPWRNTFRNQTIDVMSIKDFFSNNDPLGIK
jgi:uncharacterized phage-associated protein|nr:MAG: Protein of unknown function (DUF4065) [Bacteriophage sp.]